MKEINVEEIMAEIRKEIEEKGYSPDMLTFKDVSDRYIDGRSFDLEEFKNTIVSLELTKYVPWKQENLGGGLKGFIKKTVQKLIGFIIMPISDGQNAYNQQTAAAFFQLLGFVEKQHKVIEEYENKLGEMQKIIDKMEK